MSRVGVTRAGPRRARAERVGAQGDRGALRGVVAVPGCVRGRADERDEVDAARGASRRARGGGSVVGRRGEVLAARGRRW